MAETLTVQITAQDGATRVFKAVEGGAQTMGRAVEAAGKQGTTGMKTLASEAKRLEAEIDSVAKAAIGFGAAMTSLIAAPLAAGTKAAWDQVNAVQQATVALRAYEKDADKVNTVLADLVAYARSDMGVLFQREDLFRAAQSLRVMGAETENLTRYVEIMSRSVGVGAGTWAELEQVIGRVGSTGQLTGVEFDNLTKMGFQLDDSLRNSVVTWEELFDALDQGIPADAMLGQVDTIQAGVIRLQSAVRDLGVAFLGVDRETSQFIEGGLGDQLVDSLGQARETLISLQPAAQAFGQGVGTAFSAAMKLVDAFNALPGPAQKAIAMTTGIGGATLVAAGSVALMVNPVLRLSNSLLTLGRSAAAMRVLSLATNPLALGLTAVATAGAVLWNSWREGEEATKRLEDALLSLSEVETQLRLDHEDAAAESVRLFRLQAEGAESWAERFVSSGRLYDEAVQRSIENGSSFGDELVKLEGAYTRNNEEAEQFASAQVKIGEAFRDTRIDSALLGADLDKLHEDLLAGRITLDEYDDGVIDVSENLDRYRVNAEEATVASTGLAEAWNLLKVEGEGVLQTLLNLNTITEDDSFAERFLKTLGLDASQRGELEYNLEMIKGINAELEGMPEAGATQQEWLDWVNEEGISQSERTKRANAANEARREEERTTRMASVATAAHTSALEAGNAALEEQQAQTQATIDAAILLNEAYEERQQLITENLEALVDVAGFGDPLSQWNLTGHATQMSLLADAIGDAATSLETVNRVIVSNTDAIADQVDSVHSWAEELINVEGQYGLIDDLIAAGRINQEQYNAAQLAYNDIAAANVAIQEDVLTIQAKQAPLIAEHTQALEQQMSIIADLPAQQQLIALGWMDATTAGRAMEFQTLAVAAAAGELGRNGDEAFATMIAGAAQADPVLAALLEDMGLITQGADGSITVHIPEDTVSEMDRLTIAIVSLADLLDDGELNGSINMEVLGIEDVEQAQRDIEAIPPQKDVEVGLTVPDGLFGNFVNDVIALQGTPEIPVSADTTLAEADINDLRSLPPLELPVALDIGGLGASLGAGAAGAAQSALQDVALGQLQEIQIAAESIPSSVTIDVSVPNASTAIDSLSGVQAAAEAVPDTVFTWTGVLGHVDAIGSLNGVEAAAEAIPNSVMTVISAVDNASAVIGDAVSFLASVDGYESTMTLNVVTNQITRLSTVNARHGGVPGYAHGGVIAELAEAGPEMLHLASGGVVPVLDRGYYGVPSGTYVSPANATPTMSGVSVQIGTIHVAGNVTSERELTHAIAGEIESALESAIVQRRDGFGGV